MSSVQTETIAAAYDNVPYQSNALWKTAPEHLRAVASLFSIDTPAPDCARVLELGCAAGGNIIPFAMRYPHATVVGVDLSSVQIAAGRRAIKATGLQNIKLIQANIADLDKSLGEFDYIICHGVYSWVPEEVRADILRIASECLSPDGVANISYNTYPGWKAKEIIRDAMLLRSEGQTTQQERLAYARGMIDFMHDMATPGSLIKHVMEDHIDTIRHAETYYLVHEFLEVCNNPCYFKDFLAAAKPYGLGYLAEANIMQMFLSNFREQIAEPLRAECGDNQIMLEQLLDFLVNRTFRQTLLIHEERTKKINYVITPERIRPLHIACNLTQDPDNPGIWRTANDVTLNTHRIPAVTQIIDRLNAAWPGTVPVATLLQEAMQTLEAHPEQKEFVEQSLLRTIQTMVISDTARFRLEPVTVSHAEVTHPRAPQALRALSELLADASVPLTLANRWHEPVVKQSPFERQVFSLMDGSRDLDAVTEAIYAATPSIEFPLVVDEKVYETRQALMETLRTDIEIVIAGFSQMSLLGPAEETTPTPTPPVPAQTSAPAPAPSSRAKKSGSTAKKTPRKKPVA